MTQTHRLTRTDTQRQAHRLVGGLDEAIVKDAVVFVDPELDELVGLVKVSVRHEDDAADDAEEVPEVEDVVALGGSGQEAFA